MYIITGGGSGIGRSLAHELAVRRGHKVLIVGRSESLLVDTAKFSPLIDYLRADLSCDDGRRILCKYLDLMPNLAGLIHSAGIIGTIAPMIALDESCWRSVMAINLETPLVLNKLLHDKLLDKRVLHIGSGAAHFPVLAWAPYCVSKAALSMLNSCLQLEQDGVAYTCVMPGIVDTKMQFQIRNATAMDPLKHDFFQGLYENKHLLSTETVARFLSWLLLDIDLVQYVAKEWDIYDRSHHKHWLVPPHKVPQLPIHSSAT